VDPVCRGQLYPSNRATAVCKGCSEPFGMTIKQPLSGSEEVGLGETCGTGFGSLLPWREVKCTFKSVCSVILSDWSTFPYGVPIFLAGTELRIGPS